MHIEAKIIPHTVPVHDVEVTKVYEVTYCKDLPQFGQFVCTGWRSYGTFENEAVARYVKNAIESGVIVPI